MKNRAALGKGPLPLGEGENFTILVTKIEGEEVKETGLSTNGSFGSRIQQNSD